MEFDPYLITNKTIDYLTISIIFGSALTSFWLLKSISLASTSKTFTLLCTSLLSLAVITIDLFFRTAVLADVSFSEASEYIPKVLEKSEYGFLWQLRIAAWVVLFFSIAYLFLRKENRFVIATILITISFSAFLLSATGHAGEDGALTFANFNNWLHLVGIAMWGGSVISYVLFVLPIVIKKSKMQSISLAATQLTNIATIALATVIITGVINTLRQVSSLTDLTDTFYGQILIVKLLVVAIMMGIGAFNRFYLVPSVEKSVKDQHNEIATAKRFRTVLSVDSCIFIIILFLAVTLGMQMPPAHM